MEDAEAFLDEPASEDHDDTRFHDRTPLYVGGRPSQVDRLRGPVRACGGLLLVHDGGVEDGLGLLPGLASRAEAVFLPVDCVSHGAMALAKRHGREQAKPFLTVRHANIGGFVAAAARHLASDRQRDAQSRDTRTSNRTMAREG